MSLTAKQLHALHELATDRGKTSQIDAEAALREQGEEAYAVARMIGRLTRLRQAIKALRPDRKERKATLTAEYDQIRADFLHAVPTKAGESFLAEIEEA